MARVLRVGNRIYQHPSKCLFVCLLPLIIYFHMWGLVIAENDNFAEYFQHYIMSNGTVKFFNDSKGYGFITPEEGGKDLFVHVNGLNDDIAEGDKVSFDTEEGRKGPNAINVSVL